MHEILFRGKRKDNGKWVEGHYGEYYNGKENVSCISIPKETISGSLCYDVIPETVGQYTGLTDKNGLTKVFEGDIVKYSEIDIDGSDLVGLGVISWNQKTACFTISNGAYHDDFCQVLIEEIEVIGNIFDNPELIKEAEKI